MTSYKHAITDREEGFTLEIISETPNAHGGKTTAFVVTAPNGARYAGSVSRGAFWNSKPYTLTNAIGEIAINAAEWAKRSRAGYRCFVIEGEDPSGFERAAQFLEAAGLRVRHFNSHARLAAGLGW